MIGRRRVVLANMSEMHLCDSPIVSFGIAAIVGESFGEIFAGNCVSIGMPCVTADADTVRTLQDQCEAEPLTEIKLDLVSMTVANAGRAFPVDLAEGRRQQFLRGTWDPTAVLLEASAAIDAAIQQLPSFPNSTGP